MMNVCGIVFAQACTTLGKGFQVEVESEIDGKVRSLWAVATEEVRDGTPVVVLLAEGSTPEHLKVAPDAQDRFRRAVRALARHGQRFHTVLRTEWDEAPVLLWEPCPIVVK